MMDFYLRAKPQTPDRARLQLSRGATLVWAVLLFALALASRHGGKVLETGLTIASLAYGGLLGVFLLGVLTKRATQTGTIFGMLCGLALNIYLWSETRVAWTWYVTLGATITFVTGYVASLLFQPRTEPTEAHARN
jgi:solute:Na+ symporter, SSS family